MFGYCLYYIPYVFTHTHIQHVYFFSQKKMCMFFLKNIGICLCSHSPSTTDHIHISTHTQRYVNEMKLWSIYMGFHIGLLLGYLLGWI